MINMQEFPEFAIKNACLSVGMVMKVHPTDNILCPASQEQNIVTKSIGRHPHKILKKTFIPQTLPICWPAAQAPALNLCSQRTVFRLMQCAVLQKVTTMPEILRVIHHKGAVAKWLEHSSLAPKVRVQDGLRAGFFENSLCSLDRGWVPGCSSEEGKMKAVRKKRNSNPQLYHCRYDL